ncbi:MAG: hypothetical protein U9N87_13010 [Planctomycetota bacterium]|nr:hypothetical protein [Planctomycetota bacterium]
MAGVSGYIDKEKRKANVADGIPSRQDRRAVGTWNSRHFTTPVGCGAKLKILNFRLGMKIHVIHAAPPVDLPLNPIR